MLVQHFYIKGIAHSSYLLAGGGACAIVDPIRDVGMYTEAADALGVRITHILETHLHADFVSGHLELAERTQAAILAPRAADCRFEHIGVAEGDVFPVGELWLSVLETAGHTPEHVSFVVTDRTRGSEPVAVFCGDTLFVGDVGRPDLFPGRAAQLAARLFDNLHGKLMKLPDFCEVYPAHGAGSLCGRALSAKRTSTIGYERRYNKALQIRNKEAFIASLTTGMPAAPDHFARCSAVNAAGPALVSALPTPRPLSPVQFAERAHRMGTVLLDIREYEGFAAQHIPGAWHVDLTGNFATFAGWVLPADSEIILVAADGTAAEQAAVWLRRVGLDRVTGYLDDGMFAWARAGLPTEHIGLLCAGELHQMITGTPGTVLIDVRAAEEFATDHLEGAVNIPAPDLRRRHAELPREVPVTLICSSGQRSSLAASILQRQGFTDLRHVAGGMGGYAAAGFARTCPLCHHPHGPRLP